MTVVTRGTLVIDIDRCKGCELCIAVCPPAVLFMSSEQNTLGYRFPELAPGCTGCTACQKICPDYVFEVFKLKEPQLFETGSPAP